MKQSDRVMSTFYIIRHKKSLKRHKKDILCEYSYNYTQENWKYIKKDIHKVEHGNRCEISFVFHLHDGLELGFIWNRIIITVENEHLYVL